MTTGELLDSKSSVSNVSALTHLQNISGGGTDRYIPYDDMVLDIQVDRMEADISKQVLSVEVQRMVMDVEVDGRTLEADIETKNKEIDNGCDQ